MNYKKFLKNLPTSQAQVKFNEPLKNHTSFKIGGNAKYFVVAHTQRVLQSIFAKTKNVFVLGGGTNILFQDGTYNGTILKLGDGFKKIKVKPLGNEQH